MELAETVGYNIATLPDDLEKSVVFRQKMAYINMYKARIVALCGGVMPLDEGTHSIECDTSCLECDMTPADASTDDPTQ